MRADSWGPEAATRVLSGMTKVTRPPDRLSSLEDEVTGLRQTGLAESPGGALTTLRDLGAAWRSWFDDLSLILVDAAIARDKPALDAADELIREFHRALAVVPEAEFDEAGPASEILRACRSWAQLTSQHVRHALDRVAPAAAGMRLRGTRRERFLQIVAERPGVKSREIREWFNTGEPAGRPRKLMDEGQLSRLGHGLRAEGFVLAERGPHGLSWELTPRGEEVLAHLSGAGRTQGATRMVVSTGRVPAGEIAHLIHDDPPPSIWFLRAHDVIRYRQTRRVAEPINDLATQGPHSIDAAIKGLMNDHQAPTSFRVNERLYERVA